MITDSLFFSGIALVDAIFGVFIVQQIANATVVNLGIGSSLYTIGIILTEPIFSSFYDRTKNGGTAFYGYVLGNFLKTIFRFGFIFVNSVPAYYLVYFLLGIVHSIAYPSFSKVFTRHIEPGNESVAWGYKDFLLSLGSIVSLVASGFIAVIFGYKFLFVLSSIILLLSGVIYPLLNRSAFLDRN
jgi:MFS family permease